MFKPTKSGKHPGSLTGTQDLYKFKNGYTASVIQTPYSYGSNQGLFELAVMYNGDLVYDTPITNDVIGYLTPEAVQGILQEISELPTRRQHTTPQKDNMQ